MYIVTTPPTIEPISLADALDQCNDIAGARDAAYEFWISAAREWCETIKDRALITQTRRMVFPAFARSYRLQGDPIQSITSLEYRVAAGTWSTWASTNYVLDELEGRLCESSTAARPDVELYQVNPVRITYVCGYGATPESVPAAFRNAIRLLVAHWASQREAAITARAGVESLPIPFGVAALLANH